MSILVTERTGESEPPKSLVKPSRAISARTTMVLYTQAGGRCEFDGCNEYLLEHYPTETVGNFAEQAHIYAFKEGAARGNAEGRPEDINHLSNLMLLCHRCHHLVDSVRPADYPVETLKRFKCEHEDRIFALTRISKDRDTVPLVLKGLVHGRPAAISDEEMQTAVAPNYLKRRDKIEIDLTAVPDTPEEAFWKTATAAIDHKVGRLYALVPEPERTLRVSVFALAPIPLLIYLGARLSDKINVDLYQRHRAPETWSWKEGRGNASYTTRRVVRGEAGGPVALLVNLSGTNQPDSIPAAVGDGRAVYEITLDGQDPTPLFLDTRGDLERFTREYIRALAVIRHSHPDLDVIHLFPAAPAPVAITLGRARLPKVDPSILVYDRDSRAGGFVPTLEIT